MNDSEQGDSLISSTDPQSLYLLRLNSAHLAEVSRLEGLCHPDPWTCESFISEFEADFSVAFGLFEGQNLAAMIFFWLIPPENHLLNLAVDPLFQRRGLGSRLMKVMIKVSSEAGCRNFFLECRENNLPAQKLYQGFGYRLSGVRKGYYQNGEDALVMRLNLPNRKRPPKRSM
ncbi:MAG: ribosomal protein S18-alanine N-acetyltransferase [Deltaproteobacteria bacterium]|jgi:ribosomal-protein-alanine N-acetyltransferase|nr:ribosomal protein S18-alanine N-acetyltransferase [Deltaproteobacteria bacterium]